jgi:hypothetical protein
LNGADPAESSGIQRNPPQTSATHETKICRAAPDLAAEFAAGQTALPCAEELDPELADFRVALAEHAARAEVVRVIREGVGGGRGDAAAE